MVSPRLLLLFASELSFHIMLEAKIQTTEDVADTSLLQNSLVVHEATDDARPLSLNPEGTGGTATSMIVDFTDLFATAITEGLDSMLTSATSISVNFWKDSDERVVKLYNPSAVVLGDASERILARLSNDTRCSCPDEPHRWCEPREGTGLDRQGLIVECSTVLGNRECTKMWSFEDLTTQQDRMSFMIVNPETKEIHAPQVADPHVFIMDGHPMGLMTIGVLDNCTLKLVNLSSSAVFEIQFPDAAACEKNWSPFVHDGQLFFSWWLQPQHRVLHCSRIRNAQQYSCKLAFTTPNSLPMDPGSEGVHAGSPAVELDDEHFVAVAHTRNMEQGYLSSIYATQRRPPFRVVAQTPWFKPPILARDIGADWSVITYVGGLAVAENDLILSYGVGDCHSVLTRLPTSNVKSALAL